MNLDDELRRAVELSNSDAAGQVAVAGIAAICSELARLGALDLAAVERVRSFMLDTLEKSGASSHFRSHLGEAIERHLDGAEELARTSSRASQDPQ